VTRSENMRRIRSRDSTIELLLRKELFRLGLRYRCSPTDLPGKPDIVFRSARVAVFVHGCFWHQHGCRRGRLPKSNTDYWEPKLKANAVRDRLHAERLRVMGFSVVQVWECSLQDRLQETADEIKTLVRLRH
jgi:DNA mismatch endonuclease (patch repair protein)